MSVPHAAAAFGFAFLFAPSGWLVRLFSPWATGFDRPPDWLIINDPMGYALLAGLVLKEIPFLFLMSLSAASQIKVDQRLKLSRSMGYGRLWAWIVVIMPAFYRQIRLPIFAVIAFSSSVVDVALILGPNLPPSLPVQILRWMNDPDIEMRFVAAAGALFQLGATLAALMVWWLLEMLAAWIIRRMQIKGARYQNDIAVRGIFYILMVGVFAISVASLIILGIWSVAAIGVFLTLCRTRSAIPLDGQCVQPLGAVVKCDQDWYGCRCDQRGANSGLLGKRMPPQYSTDPKSASPYLSAFDRPSNRVHFWHIDIAGAVWAGRQFLAGHAYAFGVCIPLYISCAGGELSRS